MKRAHLTIVDDYRIDDTATPGRHVDAAMQRALGGRRRIDLNDLTAIDTGYLSAAAFGFELYALLRDPLSTAANKVIDGLVERGLLTREVAGAMVDEALHGALVRRAEPLIPSMPRSSLALLSEVAALATYPQLFGLPSFDFDVRDLDA